MPELPEVETVCRIMRRVLVGHRIVGVEVVPDTIIFGDTPPEAIISALKGRVVEKIGRKGKTWWIDCGSPPILFGHLGMTGWIRELGAHTTRLKEHGNAPLDDASGGPRFLKLLITTEEGKQISFTDARRLAHVWLSDSPSASKKVAQLGPDALENLPKAKELAQMFAKRTAPVKALLMDQTFLSGIGNWVADEVLYMAKIAPQRGGSSLSDVELERLRKAILSVLQLAVDAGADHEKYPENWMFHHRWGGGRGHQKIGKHDIVREQVGGRTTAWVPGVQK